MYTWAGRNRSATINSDAGCASSTSRRALAYLAHQDLDGLALLRHVVVPVVVPRLNTGQAVRLQPLISRLTPFAASSVSTPDRIRFSWKPSIVSPTAS